MGFFKRVERGTVDETESLDEHAFSEAPVRDKPKKPIDHKDHAWRSLGGTFETINPTVEAHELAADVSKFGALAIASIIEAGAMLSQPVEIDVPNPINKRMLRKRLWLEISSPEEEAEQEKPRDKNVVERILGEGTRWEAEDIAVEADAAVREIQQDLEALSGLKE